MIIKENGGQFKCLLCLKTFTAFGSAKKHHLEIHTESHESHVCQYCDKSFKFKRYLNDHLVSTSYTTYACNLGL